MCSTMGFNFISYKAKGHSRLVIIFIIRLPAIIFGGQRSHGEDKETDDVVESESDTRARSTPSFRLTVTELHSISSDPEMCLSRSSLVFC